MSRRLRAFKRWMKHHGIEYSYALEFTDGDEGIAVKAACDLKEGDHVGTIPKDACLTMKTSRANELIEEAGLAGSLGLSFAVMFEKSLGNESLWDGYLQLLPVKEDVPLVWTVEEVDMLLCGTELHKIVKEDKLFLYQDWKECILPVVASSPLKLSVDDFGIEQYFAAKSLVSSRSFEIDNYHGFGMVPLADLFNHKTGAENVHFTEISPCDDDDDNFDDDYKNLHSEVVSPCSGDITGIINEEKMDYSSDTTNDSSSLEMIVVKGVKSGEEVFNTYGSIGNAALLHRYGFAEPNNPFDIVNIDLNLVVKWASSLFSSRYVRSRLSLWRGLNCSGCISQNSEYFEVSYDGEPQVELLILLYSIFLVEKDYEWLNCNVSSVEDVDEIITLVLSSKFNGKVLHRRPSLSGELLTDDVCDALVKLANIRESFYGSISMEEDLKRLNECCQMKEKKLYYSLILRVSERKILERLRAFASSKSSKAKKNARRRL